MSGNDVRPPVPPFTAETALKKVKAAQDLWNTKDPEKVILAYTVQAPCLLCAKVPSANAVYSAA